MKLFDNFLRNTPFRQQLTVAVTLGVLALAIFSSLASSWEGSNQIRRMLREQGERIADNLAKQSRLALLTEAAENADSAVATTLTFPDVLEVEISRANGKVLLRRDKGKPSPFAIPGGLKVNPGAVGLEAETDLAWRFIAPVFSKEAEVSPFAVGDAPHELLGYVQVVQSKETLQRMRVQIFAVNFGISLFGAFLFLFAIRFLTNRLTRPLHRLSNDMAKAEAGEHGIRAEQAGPKDIAEMAHAFNSMMAVLEEREQELRQARDDAMKFASLKAEFAATMSHEIRTPLNGVVGALDILKATLLPKKQSQFVKIAWDSSQYLLDLINNILDFSRLEAGKLALDKVDFSVVALIEEIIELLATLAHKKGIDLGYVVADDVPKMVNGDPRRIRQVLINLLSNAIKFTETGEVAVYVRLQATDAQRHTLLLEVIDTGVGIAPDACKAIFDSFTQADTSTTRRYGGSGLGLAICRQLVQLMGGEIAVDSTPGHGSRFWFTTQLDAKHATSDALTLDTTLVRPRRVLIVDASPIAWAFLQQALSRWQCDCQRSTTQQEALDLLEQAALRGAAFDLVMLDESFTRPDATRAPGLAQQILNGFGQARPRLIGLARYGAEGPQGVSHIVDLWLAKPLKFARLLDSIQTLDCVPEEPAPAKDPTLAHTLREGSYRILVAEDNRTNQMIAQGMLLMLGCKIELVNNGNEAVQAVRRQRWDLVLMDCNMPEMDGYQATTMIRAEEAHGAERTIIVAMTANTRLADVEKCMAAGMDDHLAKPLTLEAVEAKLQRWLVQRMSPAQALPEVDPTELVPASREPLDQVVVAKLREALGDALDQAIHPFLEDMPGYLDELHQALLTHDSERLRSVAHAVKGASGNLGAAHLAGIAREIEEQAEAEEMDGIHALLSGLQLEYARVEQALLDEIKSKPSAPIKEASEGTLVLVADDDRSTRSALTFALRRSGFRVEEASDGAEALLTIERIVPDVILMDAMMPVMDGFSACAKLQEMPLLRDIPVLMVTALEDSASIERVFAVGASDYIPKPIHLAVVKQRVKRLAEATKVQRHVRHLAFHDTVTGLPNRVQFADQMQAAINRAARQNASFAILFLDLDRFKFVNDTLGHEIGDRLLGMVAHRIRGSVRSNDCLARLGGDEFTLLLDDLSSPATAAGVAQNIERAMANAFEVDGHDIFVSASIGISIYPGDGTNVSTLLRHADTAMYRAKRNNSGFEFYEADMDTSVSEHLQLENALRRALERNELIVHYQPVAENATGRIVGMEALVRWQHPVRGMIAPLDFIPLAEETGLIIPIGTWVLRTACVQARAWLDAGLHDLRMAVNLSSHQLQQANFIDLVREILLECRLPAVHLTLEITESVLMAHARETVAILRELKDIGVNLAIDDFGTGYSSLTYLKRFPVDTLKIDYSFTRDITTDPDDAAIVTGIVALAHSLRLKVVAEGVEHEAQRVFLTGLDCDSIQGYYLSKPMLAGDLDAGFLLPHLHPDQ